MDVMQFPRMVVSSRDGWDLVAQARPPMDWLFRRLVLPMSLLPPLMILLASGGVGERVFPEAGFGNWLIAAVLFFVAEHFSVPIMANSIRQASMAKDGSNRLEDAYAVADLVLCRSGAGTVAELSALGLPGFFIPLPIGNGEQEFNASDVVAADGAALARDKDFTPQIFAREVMPLLHDHARLTTMGEAARGVSPVDAADRLANLVLQAISSQGRKSK